MEFVSPIMLLDVFWCRHPFPRSSFPSSRPTEIVRKALWWTLQEFASASTGGGQSFAGGAAAAMIEVVA